MAKEIGVTPSQLHELASNGPGNANLLKSMLLALHVDAEVLADMDPLIVRELKWLCITCGNKEQCEHELTEGTAAEHFREFCPNTVSLDDLLDQRDVMYCLQPNKRALHGHVRFGSEADMCAAIRRVRFTPNSDGESRHLPRGMSALPSKADMCGARADVCYGPIADIRAEQAS
jgi:hypothetical protein